jgi:glycosyltransferase involved in cell wall biosynthesis
MIKQEKLRLLLVTDFFYPHWTGIAKSVFSLTQKLQETFATTVLTVRFDKKLPKRETVEKTEIIRSDYLLTISRSKYSFAMLLDFLKLASQNDYILINSPSANIVFFAVFAKLFGKKLFIFHQGDLILPKGVHNRVIEKVFDLSCFIAFSLADKVSTYTSDYAKHSRVLRPFLKKITPVLLPVTLQTSDQKTKPLEALVQLQKQKKSIFGFAGRFVEEKGFDILFRAIPRIIEKIPNAHFVIAGQEMSYENFFGKNNMLFEQVKPQLTFLGLLNDSQLQQFYRGIDGIVVPSRSDCFNLVQAEAMLYGTPALVSDIPGLRYLVKESGFGMTFKSQSPEALADAIIEFVKKKPEIMKNEKKIQELLEEKKIIANALAFITD